MVRYIYFPALFFSSNTYMFRGTWGDANTSRHKVKEVNSPEHVGHWSYDISIIFQNYMKHLVQWENSHGQSKNNSWNELKLTGPKFRFHPKISIKYLNRESRIDHINSITQPIMHLRKLLYQTFFHFLAQTGTPGKIMLNIQVQYSKSSSNRKSWKYKLETAQNVALSYVKIRDH